MTKVDFQNINFKSRNPIVRKADKICRMVNTEFSSISSSKLSAKVNSNKKYDKFYQYARGLSYKLMHKVRDELVLYKSDIIERYKKIAELVKKEHLANCDELTCLAGLICAANGIKSQRLIVHKMENKTLDKKSCEHVALALTEKGDIKKDVRMSDMKDVIIIDPWLGLADYAPNVAQKYKNIFPQYLNLKDDDEVFMVPANFKFVFQESDFERAREEFPNFVIENKS